MHLRQSTALFSMTGMMVFATLAAPQIAVGQTQGREHGGAQARVGDAGFGGGIQKIEKRARHEHLIGK